MYTTTLTLSGSAEALGRVLQLWQTLQEESTRDIPDEPVPATLAHPNEPLAQFRSGLQGRPQWFVQRIVEASTDGGPGLLRSQIVDEAALELGIEARAAEAILNGWTGSIGRSWRKAFGQRPNAFAGQPVSGGGWRYHIDQQLADGLAERLRGADPFDHTS